MPDNKRFTREKRLLTHASFQAVFREKKKRFGGCFIVYSRKNGLGYSRIGVILSKKQISLASRRNRVKRVVKESFRLNQTKLPDLDLVVVCLKKADSLRKKELSRCITEQWLQFQPELIDA